MQIDGRRSNRRGGSTGGGQIEGANRRIRGPIGGANRRSGSQRPCSKQEPRIGGVEGAAMAGWRRRAAGFQVPLPPPSSLPLSLLSFPPNLSILCAAGMGRAHAGGICARFPPRSLPATLFSARAQPILRPCSVRLDESDAKVTTRAREATP